MSYKSVYDFLLIKLSPLNWIESLKVYNSSYVSENNQDEILVCNKYGDFPNFQKKINWASLYVGTIEVNIMKNEQSFKLFNCNSDLENKSIFIYNNKYKKIYEIQDVSPFRIAHRIQQNNNNYVQQFSNNMLDMADIKSIWIQSIKFILVYSHIDQLTNHREYYNTAKKYFFDQYNTDKSVYFTSCEYSSNPYIKSIIEELTYDKRKKEFNPKNNENFPFLLGVYTFYGNKKYFIYNDEVSYSIERITNKEIECFIDNIKNIHESHLYYSKYGIRKTSNITYDDNNININFKTLTELISKGHIIEDEYNDYCDGSFYDNYIMIIATHKPDDTKLIEFANFFNFNKIVLTKLYDLRENENPISPVGRTQYNFDSKWNIVLIYRGVYKCVIDTLGDYNSSSSFIKNAEYPSIINTLNFLKNVCSHLTFDNLSNNKILNSDNVYLKNIYQQDKSNQNYIYSIESKIEDLKASISSKWKKVKEEQEKQERLNTIERNNRIKTKSNKIEEELKLDL